MRYLPRHVKVADVLSKRYLDAGIGVLERRKIREILQTVERERREKKGNGCI